MLGNVFDRKVCFGIGKQKYPSNTGTISCSSHAQRVFVIVAYSSQNRFLNDGIRKFFGFSELDDRQKDDEPNQCSDCRDDVFLIEEHGDKDKREKGNRQRVQNFICRHLESVFHKVARLTVAIMSNHRQNANKNIDVAAN